jgi:hypothetical protein
MGDRILGEVQQGNVSTVIPLRHQQHVTTADRVVTAPPEPVQLYA